MLRESWSVLYAFPENQLRNPSLLPQDSAIWTPTEMRYDRHPGA